MAETDGRWVSSSRIASPDALRPLSDTVALLDTVLQVYGSTVRVLEGAAEAELWLREALSTLNARQVAGKALSLAASEVLGDYLTDAAHVLFHTNLRNVLDNFGIAPYLDDPQSRQSLTVDPVPTQFPLPYSAEWFRQTASRLGSSTLRGLEQEPLRSGFALWQQTVLDAFRDRGDFQRPAYSGSEKVGAFLITVQASDPRDLFDKFSTLVRLFSTRPAEIVLPNLAQFVGEADISLNLRGSGRINWPRYVRPSLVAESWNTPPDFARVSTRDLIPLIGDVFLDLQSARSIFDLSLPDASPLGAFVEGLDDFVGRFERLLGQASSSLSSVLSLLTQPGFSRLWIPVEVGGTERITSMIEEAASTRRDMQRVVSPGTSPFRRNQLVPYADIVAAQALHPQLVATPAENLLVAGVCVVLREGPLAELFDSLFAPKAEDGDENDGGPSVTADLRAAVASPILTAGGGAPPLPTQGAAGRSGRDTPGSRGARNPADAERTSWSQAPIQDEAPVGTTSQAGGAGLVRAKAPHATAYLDRGTTFLQVVRGGSPRHDVLWRPVLSGSHERRSAPVCSGESLPCLLTAPETALSGAVTTGVSVSLVSPVGEGREDTPATYLPLTARQFAWSGYEVSPGQHTIEAIEGGQYFTSATLDALVSGLGHVGDSTTLRALTGSPWWADVPVEWSPAPGDAATRRAVVRVELLRAEGPPGSIRFTVEPALPRFPVVTSDWSDAIVWSGGALGFTRDMVPRGAAEAAARAEGDAPAVCFAALAGWRRITPELSDGLTSTLQVAVGGAIVEADTVQHGRAHVGVLQQGTGASTGVIYVSAEMPLLPDGAYLHARLPLATAALRTRGETASGAVWRGDAPQVTAAIFARSTSVSAREYYTFSSDNVADPVDARAHLSAQPHETGADTRALSAVVPRWARVGLGRVSSDPVALPGRDVALGRVVYVFDAGSSRWVDVTTRVDAAALTGGAVHADPELVAEHFGAPWVACVRWDTAGGDAVVRAQLLPDIRRNTSTGQRYATSATFYGDEYVTLTGDPIAARAGAATWADTLFASAGYMDGETIWFDAPLLKGTSRQPLAQQTRWVELEVNLRVPIVGTDVAWTLWETASHALVLHGGCAPSLEVVEKDLLTGTLVSRLTTALPTVVAGRTYRVRTQVAPSTRSLEVTWSQPADDLGETLSFVATASGSSAFVPVSDPFGYFRSLDGYPLPGATIRVGRPAPPVALEQRLTSPYVDLVDVYRDGSYREVKWARGAPSVAVLSIDTGTT